MTTRAAALLASLACGALAPAPGTAQEAPITTDGDGWLQLTNIAGFGFETDRDKLRDTQIAVEAPPMPVASAG